MLLQEVYGYLFIQGIKKKTEHLSVKLRNSKYKTYDTAYH